MNRAHSPGSYPQIRRRYSINYYRLFFPNTEWIICESTNCSYVIRKEPINFYPIISKYLCSDHGWLYYNDYSNY